MKNILYILPVLLLLGSCFGGGADVEEAKKEMGVIKTDVIADVTQELLDTPDPEIVEVTKLYEIEYLGENKFIELNSLDNEDFFDGTVDLGGKTLANVDTITVNFSNNLSDYPDDNYTLKSFKPGDSDFSYKAYDSYKTLDFGVNIYDITAYSDGETSKLRLTITLDEVGQEIAKQDKVNFDKKLIGSEDDTILVSLPQGGDFGDIVMLGEDSFTYSKIDDLEIKKITGDFTTSCDSITDYLTETLDNNWFYWNTCRDIIYKAGEENQTAISFYVVTLEDESYNYTKHYLDFKNSLYGTYKIKSGEWLETDDKNEALKTLNSELKQQNSDFIIVTTLDNLFKEIVR